MTQFTTDPIETLEDWNAVLAGGCCCEMPGCPVPTKECESASVTLCGIKTADGGFPSPGGNYETVLCKSAAITGSAVFDNEFNTGDEDMTHSWTRRGAVKQGGDCDTLNLFSGSGSGSDTTYHELTNENIATTDTRTWTVVLSGGVPTATLSGESAEYNIAGDLLYSNPYGPDDYTCTFAQAFGTNKSGYSWTGLVATYEARSPFGFGTPANFTATFSAYMLTEAGDDLAAVELAAGDYASTVFEYSEYLATVADVATPNLITGATATHLRIRWIIPDTFKGSYFKITWDILTEPTDPLEEKSYLQDLTWEWTGPGDPLDEDSWKSGWYEIAPPGDPGTRSVVNVRFECYRGPYGNKPQATGTEEDISDDVPLQARFTSDRHSINLATV